MKPAKLFLAYALAGCFLSIFTQQDEPRTLIYGGGIYTADPNYPHPEAVGIVGKNIVAVGRYQDVTANAHMSDRGIEYRWEGIL